MAKVLVEGFRNDDEAREFIHWYEGQGEQDAAVWLSERKQEGLPVRDFLPTDMNVPVIKQNERREWVLSLEP
jgi:hypothetical protein